MEIFSAETWRILEVSGMWVTIVEIKCKQCVSRRLALGIVPEKWALRDNWEF